MKNDSMPMKKEKKAKLEDYELDNHVRTMEDAGKIMGDKDLMKQVHKHAKKKKASLHKVSKMMGAEPDEDDMEVKSIDQIRSRSKKLKAKMNKVE